MSAKNIYDIFDSCVNLTSIPSTMFVSGVTYDINSIKQSTQKDVVLKILDENPELMDEILMEIRKKKIKKLKK